MYFRPFGSGVASLHTSFGFLYLIGAVMHIVNNFKPLKRYSIDKNTTLKLKKPFIILTLTVSLLTYLFFSGALGFSWIYDWGNKYRNAQLGKESISKEVEFIALSDQVGGYNIDIEGKLGNAFRYPMFASWIEDAEHNYIQTLYVSKSIGTSIFDYKKGKKGKHIIRRPSGLPVWAHRRNIPAADGLMIPLGKTPDLDGYTGATPLEDFLIESSFRTENDPIIHIYFEVNQSYDWNDYYSEDRFPNDSIYTISGQSGQPSLVYKAEVDLSKLDVQSEFFMTPVGHGHHSGKDGTLYSDLSNITTAYDIVERIILTIRK